MSLDQQSETAQSESAKKLSNVLPEAEGKKQYSCTGIIGKKKRKKGRMTKSVQKKKNPEER